MPTTKYVLCIKNRDYQASLMRRRLYQLIPDAEAEERGLVRVVDESGEDYLFPADLFVRIKVPDEAEAALADAT